jgi:hypothetical protein
MLLKYDMYMTEAAVVASLKRLINQTYKLLPTREEGADWATPLSTINEEIAGMARLFVEQHHSVFFPLICKMEGLFDLTEEDDFLLFRRIIFECLSLLSQLIKICQD